MPLWAVIITLVFSGLSVVGSVIGALVHARLSARNSGRLEQKVDMVAEEVGRQRTAVGACQLVVNCENQMRQIGDRIDNSHKRMDRIEGRLEKVESTAGEIKGQVRAMQLAKVTHV